MEVEANGFKRTEQRGIQLRINETLRVDVTLQVGDVNQVVAVSSTAPLLQTESGTVGHVINNRQVVEWPLNGRDFTQLTLLIPGSQAGGGFLVIGGNNVAVARLDPPADAGHLLFRKNLWVRLGRIAVVLTEPCHEDRFLLLSASKLL